MDNIEFRSREPSERLLLLGALLAGCVLLFVSTEHKVWSEFWALLAEVVGTALVLVVVMDVFFAFITSKARERDEEHRRLAREWLADAQEWLNEQKQSRG